MNLGLFGGSFDPVHCGHLLVAQAAMEEVKLDRLVFIPAARSPFKLDTTPHSSAQRLQLLRLALAGRSEFEIDPVEIHRGGISYTIDTVRQIQSTRAPNKIFWLIGADHVATLPAWRESVELARRVEFVVIPRPKVEAPTLPDPFRLHWLRGWPLAVSSSQIRERAQHGLSLRGLVPDLVNEAIQSTGMYLPRNNG